MTPDFRTPWYKDRDFLEIKVSGTGELLAHVEKPEELLRLVAVHNVALEEGFAIERRLKAALVRESRLRVALEEIMKDESISNTDSRAVAMSALIEPVYVGPVVESRTTAQPFTEEEVKYWTRLTDPANYGEYVAADARRALAINAGLVALL